MAGLSDSSRPLAALADERLGALVEEMGGREPLPAAGASLAVTLAMAAALLEKAASAQRDGLLVDGDAFARAGRLRVDALALADEDAVAYRRVVAAKSAGGDGERLRAALSRAADPPLAMAEIGLELAHIGESILSDVPLSLQGEVRAASHLACASAVAAAELVAIDIDGPTDERARHAADIAAAVATAARELSARALRC